jgi:hypothetical protein
MTPSGIELATFRFVARCLNQLRHSGVRFVLYRINQTARAKYFAQSKDSIVYKSNFNVLIWTMIAKRVQRVIVRLTKDRLT